MADFACGENVLRPISAHGGEADGEVDGAAGGIFSGFSGETLDAAGFGHDAEVAEDFCGFVLSGCGADERRIEDAVGAERIRFGVEFPVGGEADPHVVVFVDEGFVVGSGFGEGGAADEGGHGRDERAAEEFGEDVAGGELIEAAVALDEGVGQGMAGGVDAEGVGVGD